MQERFSERARHAFALANLEAGQLNHASLMPSHLMLGIIAEGTCVATETLRQLDVDLNAVRDEVRTRMKADTAEGSFGRRAQSRELKEVVNSAIHEARKLHHRHVGTEHLILGILAHAETVPAKVLVERGVDLERVREKILGVLRADAGRADPQAAPPEGEFQWIHQQELAKAFRSPSFWHTLILAVDSANRFGAGEIEPLHLLLALLREPTNRAAALLKEKGVTADWVRAQITAHADA